MVNQWGLEELTNTMPVYFVTDNARNLKAAINLSLWIPSQCFSHTLQLVIIDAKKETNVGDVIRKARVIVSHYNQLARAEKKLHDWLKVLNMSIKNLIQDVSTRWNSEYFMLNCLVENQRPIVADLAEFNEGLMLQNNDWKIVKRLVSVLQPFAEATAEISGEIYSTLSSKIPI